MSAELFESHKDNVKDFIQRLLNSRYVGLLEGEVVRLRAENRALLNSILGIAGVPPITVAAAPADVASTVGVTPSAARDPSSSVADATPAPNSSPKTGHAAPRPPRMRVKPTSDAAVPLRRRSWHQIYRMLESQPIDVVLLDLKLPGAGGLEALQRILAGFLIGSAIAAPIGLLMGSIHMVRVIFDPYTKFFRFVPSIAWLTPVVLWFGVGESSNSAAASARAGSTSYSLKMCHPAPTAMPASDKPRRQPSARSAALMTPRGPPMWAIHLWPRSIRWRVAR